MIKMEIYRLDSIEDGIAAVENPDGAMLYIPANRLPDNSKSGDCLTFENGSFQIAPEETEFRRTLIKGLLDNLINKN